MNEMQTTMVLETCCRCGQPIGPDEPYMQSVSVDIDEFSRKPISFAAKSYHLTGPCHDDARRREREELDALRASLNTA